MNLPEKRQVIVLVVGGHGSFGDLFLEVIDFEATDSTKITSAVDPAIMDSVTVVGVTGMTMGDFDFV